MSKIPRFTPDVESNKISPDMRMYIGQALDTATGAVLEHMEPAFESLETKVDGLDARVAALEGKRVLRRDNLKWILPLLISILSIIVSYLIK